MTDNGLAALAAALAPLLPQHQEGSGGYPHQSSHRTWTVYDFMAPEALAAAILAALPDDWCGHEVSQYDPEGIHVGWVPKSVVEAEIARLRAEYEGLRPLAKSGASRAHLMESGVMVRHNGTLWECEAERCIAARELAWTPEERAAKSASLRAALEAADG